MSFNVACAPGEDATAGVVHVTSELPALVMYLDPVNLAIQLSPHPNGREKLARFCRELSGSAAELAELLERGADIVAQPVHAASPSIQLVREQANNFGADS